MTNALTCIPISPIRKINNGQQLNTTVSDCQYFSFLYANFNKSMTTEPMKSIIFSNIMAYIFNTGKKLSKTCIQKGQELITFGWMYGWLSVFNFIQY